MKDFALKYLVPQHEGPEPTERILIVDDELRMRTSLKRLLSNPLREIVDCGTGYDALSVLKDREIALVLLDVNLPDLSGLEILEWITTNHLPITVIMMSAADSIDYAIKALRHGAADFVRKTSGIDDFRIKVENALHRRRLEHRHTLMNARLEHSLVFIEALLAHAPMGISVFDGESGACVLTNRACSEIMGASIERLRNRNFKQSEVWKEHGMDLLAELVLNDGHPRPAEIQVVNFEGKPVVLQCSLSRFEVEGRQHLLLTASDVSAKRHLEEENRRIESQMLHVQKLESLGVLAGGIAHDFNNILTAILGNADLALGRLDETPGEEAAPARDHLRRIEEAAHRAADLARQMLAYSGKGRFLIEPLDVNAVVYEMTQMLKVSISKKVELKFDLGLGLPSVEVDATQLRQVIMNLVINASEAIADQTGSITLATGTKDCTRAYLAGTWIDDQLPEGRYVFIEVADTGCGMDPETLAKIFDPFFTTKFTGRGLGMAAVLGIIRGHRGAIKVQTEKGKGTRFTLLFPCSFQQPREEEHLPDDRSWKGSGTVLLVDDEKAIQEMGGKMLSGLGFEVLIAVDGLEALELYRKHRDEIVCVILDLTMPQLDGEQVFRELRLIAPLVKVIVCSGYHEQEVVQRFNRAGVKAFIQKPYTSVELRRALQTTLARK